MTETAPKAPLICTGCGCTESIEQIRARNPKALSCCPERHMVDRAAYEAGKAEGLRIGRRIAIACLRTEGLNFTHDEAVNFVRAVEERGSA